MDLDQEEDKKLLVKYVMEKKPKDLWTAPECTSFTSMQRINVAQHHPLWRPPREAAALQMLDYCRKLHRVNQAQGGRSHHEQSGQSRAPFDGDTWPWAVSKDYGERCVKVAGCSVGLYDREGENLLAKEWQIETTSERLRAALRPCLCAGGHEHGKTLGGRRLWATAKYTPYLATLVAEALLTR
jgi:hypothetical protein